MATQQKPRLALARFRASPAAPIVLWGLAIGILTWPISGIKPLYGLDPSWVAGLYMGAERGLDYGTQLVFTYGPVGFLHYPSLFDVWLGRAAFAYTLLVHFALCAGLVWAGRRSLGPVLGIAAAFLAALIPVQDEVVIPLAVLCAYALTEEAPPPAITAVAVAGGLLGGIELLGSLRAAPTVLVMPIVALAATSRGRRLLPLYGGVLLATLAALWFATGNGFGNADDYVANGVSIVGTYAAAMVYIEQGAAWQALLVGAAVAVVLASAVAAGWRRGWGGRIAWVLLALALIFPVFKYAFVRESEGRTALAVATLLAMGLALAPGLPRRLARGAVGSLTLLLVIGVAASWPAFRDKLEVYDRSADLGRQLVTEVVPGRAGDELEKGKRQMRHFYALTSSQLALLRGGTVHVAPWEAGAAWAYDLDWKPLPVFGQYQATSERLDDLNAAMVASPGGPSRILFENAPVVDPALKAAVNYPGAVDARVPAYETPRTMVQMLCRFRPALHDNRWAVLVRDRDRCGAERPLRTVSAADGETVRVPRARPGEAVLVYVHGLDVSGIERLRTLLFRALNRYVGFDGGRTWNLVPGTSGDGLLLHVPPGADFPKPFALGPQTRTVSFFRPSGFLAGDPPTLKLDFVAMPMRPFPSVRRDRRP